MHREEYLVPVLFELPKCKQKMSYSKLKTYQKTISITRQHKTLLFLSILHLHTNNRLIILKKKKRKLPVFFYIPYLPWHNIVWHSYINKR